MRANHLNTLAGLAVAAVMLAAVPASAQLAVGGLKGDPKRGMAAFAPCKACHVVTAGVNRVGPSLYGVIGRKSGQVPNYKYSVANKGANIVWTPQVMFAYLENPRGYIKGTKMTYAGLKDPQKRADVIAYLATQK